jgi:hypothetical protein
MDPVTSRRSFSALTVAAAIILCVQGGPAPAAAPVKAPETGWAPPSAPPVDPVAEAKRQLQRLERAIKSFRIVRVDRRRRHLVLKGDDALTIEALRGVVLDADPPVLGVPKRPYHRLHADGFAPGEAPYIAPGIGPFRFRYFNCEFVYGGNHQYNVSDYALTHGCNILRGNRRKGAERLHLPAGTRFMYGGKGMPWVKVLPPGRRFGDRFDKLTQLHETMDLIALALRAGVYAGSSGNDARMIDIERPCLKPEQLRKQSWYPVDALPQERSAFEKRYYDGYAQLFVLPVLTARRQGWKDLSIYGWCPIRTIWWDLEKLRVDPKTDWRWNRYGKQIYEVLDILNPSVYCYYRSPSNVAYTLAIIDLNMQMLADSDTIKPIRPYYWLRYTGGGPGWRWWRGQPLPDEEVRAMVVAGFFTGFDGPVFWEETGRDNGHLPPSLRAITTSGAARPPEGNIDVAVGIPFELRPDKAGLTRAPTRFRRDDVLHVLGVDAATSRVRFQLVDPDDMKNKYAVHAGSPVYVMEESQLQRHLRPRCDAVPAMIEGLALVKPLEFILRHGRVAIDQPAQVQFASKLPVVRRVKLGPIHVLFTYDPGCIYGGRPRQIVLRDFDGRRGRTVRLDADRHARIYVVQEQ